jgi:uncharacterized membrane protein
MCHARAARAIYLQAGVIHAMPPANVSFMDEDERRAVVSGGNAMRARPPQSRIAEMRRP